jgi:hypothetical protein
MATTRRIPHPDTRQAQHLERLAEFYPAHLELADPDDHPTLSSYNRDPFDVIAALEEELEQSIWSA